jgi:hypothetical protein
VQRRFVWLAAAALALGLAGLLYPGPGRPFVRGHVGDVAATMLVYAAFGFTGWPWRTRIAATLVVAVLVEVGQLVWSPLGRSGAAALVIGSVFDPWDLAAYVAGVAVGVAWRPAALAAAPLRLHD